LGGEPGGKKKEKGPDPHSKERGMKKRKLPFSGCFCAEKKKKRESLGLVERGYYWEERRGLNKHAKCTFCEKEKKAITV